MKTLVLIRHAHALPTYQARVDCDALRPLSPEGQQKAAFTATRLAQLALKPNLIVTSPLVRAVQTAEIIAQALSCPVEQLTELNGLHDEHSVLELLLQRASPQQTLIAVGHNPNMTYLHQLISGHIRVFAPGAFAMCKWDDQNTLQPITFGE